MSESARRPQRQPISLSQLHRVKQWHVAHQETHPVESGIWETVLTFWLMGWIGLAPAYALEAYWAYPLCLLGILAPRLYIQWRVRAHESEQLKCEWLNRVV